MNARLALPPLLLLSFLPGVARADSGYSARATLTTEKISIDGKMDEPAWATAPILNGWHQTRVEPGKPAREDTEVRILYDRDNLYFGFHCLDSHPDKVTAYTVQNEGFLHQEDNVTVIIDTYLDHRNAYYFWTNLLGVRTDGRIVDDGQAYSTHWKGEWESKGRLVEDGWVVEIRIPFSNFQYDNAEEHTFGLLLDREEARLQEWSNWTPDGANSAKVSTYPHLTGLKGIAPRSVVGVTPYVSAHADLRPTAMVGSLRAPTPDTTAAPVTFGASVGADARITPTPWLSFKLTANPDFAQVDIDQDVLWLDPEERLLPERRDFFLEAQQLFVAPMTLYNSRRIAPSPEDHIWGGLQAVGKRGGTAFSILDVQATETHGDKLENVNAGVARIQQDIGRRSQVSLLGLERLGDLRHGLLGLDTNLNLVEEYFLQAQAAHTFGPKSTPGTAEAYNFSIHRYDTNWETYIQYEDIGVNFDDPLGYVPVVDKQGLRGHLNFSWFTKAPVLERVDFIYDGNVYRAHAGELKRHRETVTVQPYLGHHFALLFNGNYDFNRGYENTIGTVGLIVNPNDWQGLNVQALYGSYLGGQIAAVNGQLNLKITPRVVLRLSGFYSRSTGVPQASPLFGETGDGYQWSAYAQVRYHFSPDLYVRVTYQRGDTRGIADLNKVTGQVIDAVLGWHYAVGSDFYLVYTDQPIAGQQERQVLTKVSYGF